MATVADLGLVQHIYQPTHLRGNILDLVFSNKMIVQDVTIIPPILSDHSLIIIALQLEIIPGNNTRHSQVYFKYNEADIQKSKTEFEKWDKKITNSISENKPIDFVYNLFVQGLDNLKETCVPTKVFQVKEGEPRWMTQKLRSALQNQRKLYNKMKKHPSEYTVKRYKNARKNNKISVKNAKKSYLNRKLYKPLLSGDSKPFYRYLRTCRSNASNLIPHLNTLVILL